MHPLIRTLSSFSAKKQRNKNNNNNQGDGSIGSVQKSSSWQSSTTSSQSRRRRRRRFRHRRIQSATESGASFMADLILKDEDNVSHHSHRYCFHSSSSSPSSPPHSSPTLEISEVSMENTERSLTEYPIHELQDPWQQGKKSVRKALFTQDDNHKNNNNNNNTTSNAELWKQQERKGAAATAASRSLVWQKRRALLKERSQRALEKSMEGIETIMMEVQSESTLTPWLLAITAGIVLPHAWIWYGLLYAVWTVVSSTAAKWWGFYAQDREWIRFTRSVGGWLRRCNHELERTVVHGDYARQVVASYVYAVSTAPGESMISAFVRYQTSSLNRRIIQELEDLRDRFYGYETVPKKYSPF